ncbi:MAG: helix-turn-helix domain-containing protein [Clostridia bacterium]|nr:helix-turn-helix domain-containing protein [Clostridia bacterium]MDE6471915.1 helix-turn-helix domain-containing protein [Clostridia bacterium]
MDILTNFAENLNDMLIEHGINAKNLADSLGMGNATITRYLNKKRMPSVEYLVKIADFFNCSTDYLLGLDDEIKNTNFLPCPPFAERIVFLLNYFKKSACSVYQNESISKARFYVWKNGVGVPNVDNVVKLAKIFDCPVDFVIGRSN